jgi:pilus assembly protein Flp/PilA
MLKMFFRDESGATAIEYGLIAALISVALIGGFGTLSNTLSSELSGLADTMNNAWTN